MADQLTFHEYIEDPQERFNMLAKLLYPQVEMLNDDTIREAAKKILFIMDFRFERDTNRGSCYMSVPYFQVIYGEKHERLANCVASNGTFIECWNFVMDVVKSEMKFLAKEVANEDV